MGQVGLTRLLASSNTCRQDGWILKGMAELDTCCGVVECSPRRNTYRGIYNAGGVGQQQSDLLLTKECLASIENRIYCHSNVWFIQTEEQHFVKRGLPAISAPDARII